MACALKHIPATRLLQADAGQMERLRSDAISLTGEGGELSDEDVMALKKFLRLTRRGDKVDE